MKRVLLLFWLLLCTFNSSFSQGVWTWLKGDSILNGVAVYGTQGIPSPANTPQALYEPCEWTDLQGNFWLFGGLSDNGIMGDLWKYDISSNNWTWIKGTGIANDSGNYGTKGVPALTNEPPANGLGVPSWVSLDGDLWMYGNGALWRYNIRSNIWTWIQGPTNAYASTVPGSQGIPSPNNYPGARWECSATWVDSLGNLWMFGGLDRIVGGGLNALWKYNIATNEWTWMSGSIFTSANGNYGTIGVTNSTNVPGPRYAYCAWKDSNGEFWIFGGVETSANSFNDMWKYNPVNNEWTWMSGSNLLNDSGKHGTSCISSTGVFPSSRCENRARWVDANGRFWMYGGAGKDFDYSVYNDLWNFNSTTLKWTLTSGGSTPDIHPTYGTIGLSSLTNQPGGRAGAVSWKGMNGAFYIFGGTVAGSNEYYNNLWEYQPDSTCPCAIYPRLILGSDTAYCGSFSRVLSTNDTGTHWSTGITASQIVVTTPGKYWANVNTGCGIASDTITIRQGVYAGIIDTTKEIICTGSSLTLTISGGAGNIQWQLSTNGISFGDIPGATSSIYNSLSLSQTTYYRVKETGSCGADSSASKMIIVLPAPVAGIVTAMPDSVCSSESIITSTLKTNTSFGHLQWQSSIDGVHFTDIIGDTLNSYTIPTPYYQTNYYRIIASAFCGTDTSNVVPVLFVLLPQVSIYASISGKQVTFISITKAGGITYHWDFGDGTTSNLPNPVHTYNDTTLFFNACLIVANSIGCADTFCSGGNLISTGTKEISKPVSLNLYPNPANNTINLSVDGLTGNYELKIYNVLGQTVGAIHELPLNSNQTIPIDLNNLPAGTYELILSNSLEFYSKRFVKVK